MKNIGVCMLFLFTVSLNAQKNSSDLRHDRALLFIAAKEDIDAGNLGEAIKEYTHIIALNSKDTQAYMLRGLIKYKLKKYKDAIKDYNKAIDLDPINSETYNNRGAAKSDLLFFKEGIEDYSRAIELDSNSDVAYFNRGKAYFNSGYLKRNTDFYLQAIGDFTKTIQLNPNYDAAYYSRGYIESNCLKQYSNAVADFKMAIKLAQSNNPDYIKELNLAKQRLEKVK